MRVINLCGPDGNAYVVLGLTRRYMTLRGDSAQEIAQMTADAISADYPVLRRMPPGFRRGDECGSA